MTNSNFQQRAKVGVAGSFFNQLMANNQSIPEVGKGATELHYSDRTCYEVIEVSEDLKTVRLQYLDAKWDRTKEGGMGHQNWILEPRDQFVTVVWRNNSWKTKTKKIEFTKKWIEENQEKVKFSFTQALTEEQRQEIYQGECEPQKVVEGITEEKNVYNKIRILFGSKDYYYDWSF